MFNPLYRFGCMYYLWRGVYFNFNFTENDELMNTMLKNVKKPILNKESFSLIDHFPS